jgi:leucyl/phenylalanyl-tRNA--protein transferase
MIHPDELQPEFLLAAYASGIFPMAQDGEIAWYSPEPRAILELDQFKAPRSLRQRVRRGGYDIRVNQDFRRVMECCADRPEGTWISPAIVEAYCRLHQIGRAHSVETYYNNELAGGLYGACLGGAFFGESMFTLCTDGSKLALVALVERLVQRGFELLDVQFLTPHLARFGAVEIPRKEYLRRLRRALQLDVTFA